MAKMILVACKECSYISETDSKNEKTAPCPRCGGQTSKDFQGFVAVTDFERSEIAKRMGISSNGRYALKVR